MTSYVVSNQAQLNKALIGANGGDSIVLASSFKDASIFINGFNKAGGLTISSESDGLASASILKIFNSTGITVKNLDIPQAAGKTLTVAVRDSQNIDLSGLHIHGESNLANPGCGMEIRRSTSVNVSNSTFDHLSAGVYFVGNTGLTLRDNHVSQIVNDGFIGSATSNLLIKDNYFTDWRHSGTAHPDAIQLYTRPGDAIAQDITVSGNVFNRGTGSVIQGIWIKDDAGIGSFENVKVTDNAIIGAAANGIGLIGVSSATVSGNLVQGYTDQNSRIISFDTRGSASLQNNTASWFSTDDKRADFAGNVVTSYLPSANLQAITSAIAAFADVSTAGLAALVQNYLKSISTTMTSTNLRETNGNTSLAVAGSVAELFANPALVRANGGQINGENTVSLAQFNALTGLGKLTLASGATLTVTGTATELMSANGYKATTSALSTSITITGDNVVNTTQLATLAALKNATLDDSARLVVKDWAVNVSKTFDTLSNAASHGLVTGITLLDKAPVISLTDSQYTSYGSVIDLIGNATREMVTVANSHSVSARDAGAVLDGRAGNATLVASDLGNTLMGGNGDTLVGGFGQDTFVLRGHFGQESVLNFDGADRVQLDRSMVSDFRQLARVMHQDGGDVVIDLGAGDILTLVDTSLSTLHASNFAFL